MPSLKTLKMTADTWVYLALGSLLLFGGSLVYSWLKDQRIDELKAKAKGHETRAEMWVQNSRKHEENAYQWYLKYDATKKELEQTKKKPVPPKPEPAPSDHQALAADLKLFGLRQEVKIFNADEYNQLHFGDAQIVWEWASQAKRVPELEGVIQNRDQIIEKQSQVVFNLEGAYAEQSQALESSKKGFAEKEAETEAVRNLLSETRKKQRAETVKWWLKAGGAALAGYVVGKQLR